MLALFNAHGGAFLLASVARILYPVIRLARDGPGMPKRGEFEVPIGVAASSS